MFLITLIFSLFGLRKTQVFDYRTKSTAHNSRTEQGARPVPCAKYAKKPGFTGIPAILGIGQDLRDVTGPVSLKSYVCQFG
jgi:hypothetical protein